MQQEPSRFNRPVVLGIAKLMAWCMLCLPLLILSPAQVLAEGEAVTVPVGPLEQIPAVRPRPEWNRFEILVYQYHTDPTKDMDLYKQAGLHGFHIDQGAGLASQAEFSNANQFVYYNDHAAGKGILYLRGPDKENFKTAKGVLVPRPNSLADPANISSLKATLNNNVSVTKKGLVLGYAFDDEISLGDFVSPVEVDTTPASVDWYHKWLAARYQDIGKLNGIFGTKYASFDDVKPVSFGTARRETQEPKFADWNLSGWMEWHQFMDYQFLSVLRDLTVYTNSLDPNTPAGFVGGQKPSAYGGYDYAYLCRAVQFMEAYDIGGSNEVLRSFWNKPRRPHLQTYFLAPDTLQNQWTLWYRLAHGVGAVICWPAGDEETPNPWFWFNNGAIAPQVQQLSETFKDIQGPASELIVSPDTSLEADPIGIYYSQPSIRVSWIMDALTHSTTWPMRSSSMENNNSASGNLRVSWDKLLEDLGYQYDFVSYLDVQEGKADLSKFKVIILPQVICLSDTEAAALRQFVAGGGMLIADNLCGLLTETGKGRKDGGALDDVFGVTRNESQGYWNGKTLTEVDGEKDGSPFEERLGAYEGSIMHGDMVVTERGTTGQGQAEGSAQVNMHYKKGNGKAVYLNMTPMAYYYPLFRTGNMGKQWREDMAGILKEAGLSPRVVLGDTGVPAVESLLWRQGNKYCLALIKNYFQQTGISGAGSLVSLANEMQVTLDVKLNLGHAIKSIRNMRNGKDLGASPAFSDDFKPWEANIYEIDLGE